jgi:hypothetical protein
LLLHPEFDGRNRIGRVDHVMLRFIRVDQRRKDIPYLQYQRTQTRMISQQENGDA